MGGRVREWLYDRAHLDPEQVRAWNASLPKGVGWLNTLGSTAVALLILQAVTGIFLAMYYSPHPDAAYETTQFIQKLPMGRLVLGVHHHGDSVLVVVVFLHLLRTYLHGAYKPPRELVWITGLILFTLILGFGFTGSLLPWDQNAYQATKVRTQYAGSIPVLGPLVLQLLRGGPDVGALTITRFYAIHALLLPVLVVLLLQWHLTLAWRKGATAPGHPVDQPAPIAGRFLDQQVLRIVLAALAAFALVYFLAWVRPMELEFKAKAADPAYHARAEWYFLFLFQFVSDFGHLPGLGTITWIPVVVIPGIVMTFLALVPWIDRGPERRASARRVVISAVAIGLIAVIGLTVRAFALLHPNATPSNSVSARFTNGGEKPLDPALLERGKQLFAAARPVPCSACHAAYSDYNSKSGPDLSGYGMKTIPLGEIPGHDEVYRLPFYDRFVKYVRGEIRPMKDGQSTSKMPAYPPEQLPAEDLDAIAAYLSQSPRRPIITHTNPRQR